MLEPSQTSQLLGTVMAGTLFFSAGFLASVIDHRIAKKRAKKREKKAQKIAELQAFWDQEIAEHDRKVIEEHNNQMAILRKQSISDNDWSLDNVF